MSFPCEDCKRPEHCTGRYPETDKHHPGEVRGCFAEKARSVAVQSAEGGVLRWAEKQEARDMDAYKRLRNDGVQPSQIMGSAILEQTDHRHVIERSRTKVRDRRPGK